MEQASLNSAELIRPIVALVALTGLVWALMVVVRNTAVFRGAASIGYYRGYTGNAPPEWIERPARAFMNLLEVPVLFYVVCVLMLVTQRFDSHAGRPRVDVRRDPRRPRGDPHRLERRAGALRRVPRGLPGARRALDALRPRPRVDWTRTQRSPR